jgi:hypothetical protein
MKKLSYLTVTLTTMFTSCTTDETSMDAKWKLVNFGSLNQHQQLKLLMKFIPMLIT